MLAADLLVIPFQPSFSEVRAAEETVKLIEELLAFTTTSSVLAFVKQGSRKIIQPALRRTQNTVNRSALRWALKRSLGTCSQIVSMDEDAIAPSAGSTFVRDVCRGNCSQGYQCGGCCDCVGIFVESRATNRRDACKFSKSLRK
jgi:hypothetical protein